VNWVQLRDKSASASELYAHVRLLRTGRVAVNDRLDVALASGAQAVHLAAKSLPVAAAVELVRGRQLLVERSVHSLQEARQAADAGADYLTFGHVFPSHSKPGLPPRGTQQLAEIVSAVEVPVLAIGGINLDNLDAVLATGCAGIAVISAILSAPEPGCATRRLRAALDASPYRPLHPFPEPRSTDAIASQSTTV
jgi:thiamine-phosphate pyrophosphorylase